MGERYDYLYSVDELDPWIDRIKTIAAATDDTYVVANNHYLGKATVNSLEIASMLRGAPVPVPPTLVQHYPDLTGFVLDDLKA